MKKRFLSLVLAVAMMVSFCVTVPAFAQETDNYASNVAINVHVASQKKQYKPGDKVAIDLELQNYTAQATGIAGFQIELDFNADLFDLKSVKRDDSLLKINRGDAFAISSNSGENYKVVCLYNTKSADPNEAIKPDGETEKDDQGLYYILPRSNNDSVIATIELPVRTDITADQLQKTIVVKNNLIFAGRGGLVNGAPQKPIVATLDQEKIDIVMPKVSSIAVKTNPTKTEYFTGDTLDLTGGVITATKDDGTTVDCAMNAEGVVVTGFDSAKAGAQTLTLTYKEKTATFAVNITKVAAKEITSMTYSTPLLGTTYEPTGTIDVTYNNGSKKTLNYPDKTVGTTVTTTVKTDTENKDGAITVTYDGKSITKEGIQVYKNKITKAEITTAPTKVKFPEGAAFSTDGKVTVTYSDGKTAEMDIKETNCKTPDMKTLGTQKVVINSFGDGLLTDIPEANLPSYNIEIVEKTLESIALSNTPKTVYETMDIDFIGMTVTGTYDNGTTAPITEGITNDYDKTAAKAGTTVPVTVTVAGKSAKFDVKVEARTLEEIYVKTQPTNIMYTEGTKIDLAGGQLGLKYNVGADAVMDMTAEGVTVDSLPTAVAPAKVKLYYQGLETILDIEVIAKAATSISVKAPTKINYYKGQSLDTTGMVVTAKYNNETTGVIANSECTVTGFDTATVGKQTLTVTYMDLTGTFDVTVEDRVIESINIATTPKADFVEEQDFATTGGKLSVKYKDFPDAELVDITTAMCSAVDMKKLGTQTVTVTYGNFKATYDINIVAKKLTSITITAPTKVEYLQGTDLEKSPVGLVVTAHYDNGKTTEIASSSTKITGYDKTKVGKQTITVTYEEKSISKSATFEINVISREEVDKIGKALEKYATVDMSKPDKDLYREMRDLAAKWDSLSAVEKEALAAKRADFDKQKTALTASTLPAQTGIKSLNGRLSMSAGAGNLFYDETVIAQELEVNAQLKSYMTEQFGDLSKVLGYFEATLVTTKDNKPVELKDGDKSTISYELEVAADSGLTSDNVKVLSMPQAAAKAKAAPTAITEVTVTGNKVAFKGAPNMQYAVAKAEKSVPVPPTSQPETPKAPVTPEPTKPVAPVAPATSKPATTPTTGDKSAIPMLIVIAICTAGLGVVIVKKKHTK